MTAHTINDFKVISLEDLDTESIAQRVLSLQQFWEPRSKHYGFYTIGKSAYLDGASIFYKQQAPFFNKILIENFPDVYITMVTCLAATLGEPVRLASDLAIPGFHIFRSDDSIKGVDGGWHIDEPHIQLKLDGTDHSTVTVAIKMPASGSGIEWLDEEKQIHYLPYKEKDMVHHSGFTVHRIAGFKEIVEGEYRITLQGHLIRRNGGMELYW